MEEVDIRQINAGAEQNEGWIMMNIISGGIFSIIIIILLGFFVFLVWLGRISLQETSLKWLKRKDEIEPTSSLPAKAVEKRKDFTKEIDLSFTVDPGSEAFFTSYSCDGVKLKQGLINLVKNAFEATVPGNFIHIALKYLPEENGSPSKLSIEISNNGQPIPEDVLENIFVPFVTYKKGGTGVGLALVKKAVDMHYGRISVESTAALTTFSIQLPL
jgi:signal transduction histidine kinase